MMCEAERIQTDIQISLFVQQMVTKEIIGTFKPIGMYLSLCLIFVFWGSKRGD